MQEINQELWESAVENIKNQEAFDGLFDEAAQYSFIPRNQP